MRLYQMEFNCDSFYDGIEDMKCYTADFETTTDVNDCRVWAYAVCDMDDINNMLYGNSIESFFDLINALPNCRIYFHNLAFDVSFILDYMLKNGWLWEDDRQPRYDKGFTTVISDMNQIYQVKLNFGRGHVVTLWDSLKIIPLSIRDEAKAFGLSMEKGELDYSAFRERGHCLTPEEIDYIRRDVQIDAQALNFMRDYGLSKMTIGSCALADYRRIAGGEKGFRKTFPVLTAEDDAFIRHAYKGGFTYVNPKYAGIELGNGISYDVNSLYPSVMASCDGQLLPYGEPEWFYGCPKPTQSKPLWIARVSLSFKIKPDHIPCIQIKGNLSFIPTEYLTDSDGDVELTVTSVDWQLITMQYDVSNVSWIGGYRFKASDNLFKQYVNKWVAVKNQATIEGNNGMRTIAKLMLNSLYGKFATQIVVKSRKPVIRGDVLAYEDLPETSRDAIYLPVGCFITAWARYKTITTAQACGDRFVYSDTDSVKIIGEDAPDIDIDPVRLGAWKDEGHFTRIKALRAKTYITEYLVDEREVMGVVLPAYHTEVHVAGLPARCHNQVTFENFRLGATYSGKLYQQRVNGGIVLIEGDFKIKE